MHAASSGHPVTARTCANVQKVRDEIELQKNISISRISCATGLKTTSVHSIPKKDLKFKPYKPRVTHELREGDNMRRLEFCNRIEQLVNDGELDVGDILFSDESHIYLSARPNKQNCRVWSFAKPAQNCSIPLHSPKITVWCGLNSTTILGPWFYEDEQGNAVTVTKERYVDMLSAMLPENCTEIGASSYFMQDGAPAHTSRMAMDWLKDRFSEKLISIKLDFVWPPRSPDLNPCDFYLWGFMKEEVWKKNHSSTHELKEQVIEIIGSISGDVLRRVSAEFLRRVKKCIEAGGGLIE